LPPIQIIVAMTRDRVIGEKGELPWNLPHDLKLFRQLTIGKTVLMGRTTYQSIGKPLAQRRNIVISRSLAVTQGIELCRTFSEGVNLARSFGHDIFCIGGVEIYRQALPLAERLHISWVDGAFSGDSLFPEFELSDWSETDRRSYTGFTYSTYLRKKNAL